MTPSNPVAPNGLIGQTIERAQNHALVLWFHLRAVGPKSSEGAQARIDFRPSGSSFRDLVLLSAWLDADERILRIAMSLERSFIDDPRQGMFARDIAKSLVRTEMREGDPPEIGHLADEIEFDRTGVAVPVIVAHQRAHPTLPQPPTRGYLTYLGQFPAHEIARASGRVHLENSDVPSRRCIVTIT